jgi:protein-S-isoprenylcysteine O-methyltransferase Ste14
MTGVRHDIAGPRVVVPPPFLFVAGWGVAWTLTGIRPFELDGAGPSGLQQGLGLAMLAGGLGLMAWALATFVRAQTPVLPVRPARVVVTAGPFRFTRNPMYLGLTIAYVGLALILNQAWPLVLLPVVLAALTAFVIDREEGHLAEAFGAEYDAYRARVRRWM